MGNTKKIDYSIPCLQDLMSQDKELVSADVQKFSKIMLATKIENILALIPEKSREKWQTIHSILKKHLAYAESQGAAGE